jgi:GNAT superfamily N-acetyltransferase
MIELDRELARFERLSPASDAEAARLLSWIFTERRIEALVAEHRGRVEGLAIFWQGLGSSFRARPFLYLEDLVVGESARGAGVGEALMAALAKEGSRAGSSESTGPSSTGTRARCASIADSGGRPSRTGCVTRWTRRPCGGSRNRTGSESGRTSLFRYPLGTSQRSRTAGWSQGTRYSSGAAGSKVSVTK